ncbi:DUF4126 family protein [Quadrisphaera sp. DSM 44207]|uniref:DUF4126 family protein n=1 Tax=Quadrisphaera sp. DSM 44207 TaxID=1881057 RepID=UPI000885B7AA|nr:DUF4126 family protein [Quadrisphaera sp. DSM 44207]SDQ06939.1 Uncharacterized membrane protein [Quadrisphaera sp. DSM 44207]
MPKTARAADDGLRLPVRALFLGLAGGLRSWPPLGILALNHDEPSVAGRWTRWPVLSSPWGRGVLIALAAGEFVADKLPRTQSRLSATPQLSRIDGGIFGRTAADALAGAALGSTRPGARSVAEGAAFAAAGALVGNYLGYHARRAVVESTGLPDPVVAVVEDAVAVVVLSAVVRTGRPAG